jgi:hypothetical protein
LKQILRKIGLTAAAALLITGFHNGGAFLRASFLVAKGWRVIPGVYREIYSHSLSDESFRQGTTWSIVVTRFLQK